MGWRARRRGSAARSVRAARSPPPPLRPVRAPGRRGSCRSRSRWPRSVRRGRPTRRGNRRRGSARRGRRGRSRSGTAGGTGGLGTPPRRSGGSRRRSARALPAPRPPRPRSPGSRRVPRSGRHGWVRARCVRAPVPARGRCGPAPAWLSECGSRPHSCFVPAVNKIRATLPRGTRRAALRKRRLRPVRRARRTSRPTGSIPFGRPCPVRLPHGAYGHVRGSRYADDGYPTCRKGPCADHN